MLSDFPLLLKRLTLKQVLKVDSIKIYILCQRKQKRNIMHCNNRNYILCYLFSPIFRYIHAIRQFFSIKTLLNISNTNGIFLADICLSHMQLYRSEMMFATLIMPTFSPSSYLLNYLLSVISPTHFLLLRLSK